MTSKHRSLSIPPSSRHAEPDLSKVEKSAIERALRWGWSELQRTAPHLANADEDAITEKLVSILNEHDAKGRRRASSIRLFETVIRDGKVTSVFGDSIDQMPDLVFRPPVRQGVRCRNDWGFFVECKIVNGAESVKRYLNKGIDRFSEGRYARYMPSAGMVAYVRDAQTPFEALDAALRARSELQTHSRISADQSESKHDRAKHECVAIAVRHLWLK